MSNLLTPDERDWLLEELGRLLASGGSQVFLAAPILEPTPRDFPDPFEPGIEGVRVLLKRILGYAGLENLEVDVAGFSQPDVIEELSDTGSATRWGHDGAAAWFAGIEERRCHFGVAEERIGEPEVLVAVLCHEVAHAWRAYHRLSVEDSALEERLTDLTTVYLGFGLLTTNAAYRYRQGGEYTGTHAITLWSHSRAGYLPPQAMSFLLAAQVRARGLGWLDRRRLAGRLETNQKAYFGWALGVLEGSADLRRRLGLAGEDATISQE